jgi:hypothetical protein
MVDEEIAAFLSYLAIDRNCSPSTQNQALNALVILFKNVLGRDLGKLKKYPMGTPKAAGTRGDDSRGGFSGVRQPYHRAQDELVPCTKAAMA